MEQGYIKIDGEIIFVTTIAKFYCHGDVVVRHVTDGKTIWETHDRLMPDLFCFYGYFVPQ